LIKSLPALLLLLGAVVFAFSLIGGVHYAEIAPFNDQYYRNIGLIAGGFLMALSVLIWFILPKYSTVTIPKASAHGIKITSPSKGANVPESVKVMLEVQKPPPQDYDLRIFRLFPRNGTLYPTSIARRTGPKGKIWEADACSLGGSPGEERIIAAFLVGPSGKALVEYCHAASDSHWKTLQELRAVKNAGAGEYLPNIHTKTQDMVECARVSVHRS
jgi:hypothetical protein